ncbi:hypothetical protein ML401_01650 [Bradyrhizobium sp. 62B]|uniref:hypothetical protein n=1 Tax=Bradyrhizobium sp. 62B TaxID=2898442 RepID=UPI002557E9B9|nr:hypothetical protein ML401_01650 [Bradyrhizobium sp. 62B]
MIPHLANGAILNVYQEVRSRPLAPPDWSLQASSCHRADGDEIAARKEACKRIDSFSEPAGSGNLLIGRARQRVTQEDDGLTNESVGDGFRGGLQRPVEVNEGAWKLPF